MARWTKPTKEEIRAKRTEIAELARTGRLKLPDAILAMRHALGMSQQQFAALFRLTRRQLAEIERGEANPTVETLERIGKPFGFRVGFVPSSEIREAELQVGVDGWRCRMVDLVLTTFDWVPEKPRGYVRDIRVRWALEDAGLPQRVKSTPFRARGAEHFSHQPFSQVPWLTDGNISIFESGAILLHLGNRSEALMPADPRSRSEAMEWLFAALNSVEMASAARQSR